MSEPEPLGRFTERAKEILRLAEQEAERLHHQYISTEHLLLGLIAQGQGEAADILQQLGAELQDVRDRVEFIVGRGDLAVQEEMKLTPYVKIVLRLAGEEARQLKEDWIEPEHMLLALVRQGRGMAVGVLETLGITPEYVQKETLARLGGSR